MSLKLGIDTGGTYTDAVIFDAANGVRVSAKALTTRYDLAVGVRAAMGAVLDKNKSNVHADLSLVAVSTTLATNAIVEGEGARTCLLLIGQPTEILSRANLGAAVGDDIVVRIDGGHDASGVERTALDETALTEAIHANRDRVQSFAVASYFAVRNPDHEHRARDIISRHSDLSVSLSHELTAKLDAPRRALTTLFNARLIPLLRELINSVRAEMTARTINATLMVVQGDGSLVAAETALHRPVETILSGPAASVHGARYLAKVEDALISDIGGTTTDIAVIQNGSPQIDHGGTRVGEWRTLVRAVRVHTVGLGGDSETRQDLRNKLTLGPRRSIPLALAASDFPAIKRALQEQLKAAPHHLDGEFAIRTRFLDAVPGGLSAVEGETWDLLADGPCTLARLFQNPRREGALARLRQRGLATRIGFTPTDAAHVLSKQSHLAREVSLLGAEVWARRLDYPTAKDLARAVIASLHRQSAEAFVTAATASVNPQPAIDSWFVGRSLEPQPTEFLAPKIQLRLPLVGIGAPAQSLYAPIAALLHTEVIVPDGAAVCNAIGAVVSGVSRSIDLVITSPAEGLFRLHTPEGISDHASQRLATDAALAIGKRLATQAAHAAGAREVGIEHQEEHDIAHGPDGSLTYIEGRISIVATGKPDSKP